MLEVLAITDPIFIIIAVSFTAVRLELFSKPDIRILGLFVIDFLAILAGSVFAIFEIPLPELVTRVADMLAMASAPTALFVSRVWQRSARKGTISVTVTKLIAG